MMQFRKELFSLLALLVVPQLCFAEVAIIVHPSNDISLTPDKVSRIFLGKDKSFPGGKKAVPINQKDAQSVTKEFNQKVIGKSSSQIRAYWSKIVFTGKGSPPKEVTSDAEVLNLISSDPNLIGYIDASKVSGGVKVIGKY
ncbi:MAG: hypothetical protein OQK04_16695 [Kangiellaceae bacterium]|nr:hypothetical protein [Kangiellaceae bacterium]MCW9000350.1 hypothetical protein [Kangiellaceae bacterium]